MTNLILLFSHQLTPEQKNDAKENLGVDSFIYLPDDLQELWSNIPADKQRIDDLLMPIQNWIEKNSTPRDYILIQGDFGSVFIMVQWSFKQQLIPVYATTTRQVVEERTENNEVNLQKIFKHQLFREYQKLD